MLNLYVCDGMAHRGNKWRLSAARPSFVLACFLLFWLCAMYCLQTKISRVTKPSKIISDSPRSSTSASISQAAEKETDFVFSPYFDIIAFSLSTSLGTPGRRINSQAVDQNTTASLISTLWNARVLEGQARFSVYTSTSCHTRDTLEKFTKKGLRCCSAMYFSELFDKGFNTVVYVDDHALLGNDFYLKDFIKASSRQPATILQIGHSSAAIILHSMGWPSKSSGVDEFLEIWMLDIHRQSTKHTLETSFAIAAARYQKQYPSFKARYLTVEKNVVLYFEPEVSLSSLVNVAIQSLEKSREIRYVPSTMLNNDPISHTADGQNVFRELNPDKKSIAFTFLHFPIRQQPSELVNFFWNRMMLWKHEKMELRLYIVDGGYNSSAANAQRPHLKLPSFAYENVLYLKRGVLLHTSLQLPKLFHKNRDTILVSQVRTEEATLSHERTWDRNFGTSILTNETTHFPITRLFRPSQATLSSMLESLEEYIHPQRLTKVRLRKYDIQYHSSLVDYSHLFKTKNSQFGNIAGEIDPYVQMSHAILEFATSISSPDIHEYPIIIRRTQTTILPLGHLAPPGSEAVRSDKLHSHRKVLSGLRHPELLPLRHKWKLADIKPFEPLPEQAGGGADVGACQLGT